MVEEKRKKQKQTTFRKEGRGKNCLHATGQRLDTRNPCTRYNPLSSNNNSTRQLTLIKKECNIKTPPHSYIVNEQYILRNKRASQVKKQRMA